MGTVYVFSKARGPEYVFHVDREPTGDSFISAADDDETFPLNPPPSLLDAAAWNLLFATQTIATPSNKRTPLEKALLTAWDNAGTDSFYKTVTARANDLLKKPENKKSGDMYIAARAKALKKPENKRSVDMYIDSVCEASLDRTLKPQEAEFFCSYAKIDPKTKTIEELFITNLWVEKPKGANAKPSDGIAPDGLFYAGTRALKPADSE